VLHGIGRIEASNLLSFHISLAALERALASGDIILDDQHAAELREEIVNDKCSIQKDSNGHLERIVNIALLRLSDSRTDTFLVCVGSVESNRAKGCCRLPVEKLATGEAPQQGVDRILQTEICDLAENHELVDVKQEQMGESSRKFNIQTTYCKIIHNVACDKLEDGATLNLHQEGPSSAARDAWMCACVGGSCTSASAARGAVSTPG